MKPPLPGPSPHGIPPGVEDLSASWWGEGGGYKQQRKAHGLTLNSDPNPTCSLGAGTLDFLAWKGNITHSDHAQGDGHKDAHCGLGYRDKQGKEHHPPVEERTDRLTGSRTTGHSTAVGVNKRATRGSRGTRFKHRE